MVQMKRKLQKQFLPFNHMQAIYKNDSWQTKNDKGSAATRFIVNVASDSSKEANTCKEEGIALILDNAFLAPKEDVLMNAPMYDQYEEEEEEEEEEEMCDSVLIIEDNKGGECIQEPVYDQYLEEVAAHIEEEEDLS